MPRRVIRTTGIVFIRLFVKHFRDDILLMRLSELLKLMKSISHRPCGRIKPEVPITSPLPATPTVALIEKSEPKKTYKSIEASKHKQVQIHTISSKASAKRAVKDSGMRTFTERAALRQQVFRRWKREVDAETARVAGG